MSAHANPIPAADSHGSGKIDLDQAAASPRVIFNKFMNGVAFLLAILALIPLFSVLYMVIVKGGARFGIPLFVELPPQAGMVGGGIANAIIGTFVMVGIASVLSVPIGILSAVFLTELGKGTKVAKIIQFGAKILSGVPSVLMGVFIYGILVVVTGQFSAIAGGLALAVLMLPIVILSTEKALLQVPRNIREASLGLGATGAQTVLRVTLPAAMPSIITGVMLAVSRAAGETAPILFTALYSDYFIWNNAGQVTLNQPTASMAALIYNNSTVPYANLIELAWAASLVLMLLVLITNVISNFVARAK